MGYSWENSSELRIQEANWVANYVTLMEIKERSTVKTLESNEKDFLKKEKKKLKMCKIEETSFCIYAERVRFCSMLQGK